MTGTIKPPHALLGLKIVSHPLARDVRTEFKVACCGPRRKRGRYCVKRIEINRPGCVQVDDTLYMHPELVAKLRAGEPK